MERSDSVSFKCGWNASGRDLFALQKNFVYRESADFPLPLPLLLPRVGLSHLALLNGILSAFAVLAAVVVLDELLEEPVVVGVPFLG